MSAPPPLPTSQPPPVLNPPLPPTGARPTCPLPGTEGMTSAQIQASVAQGARFVRFQYCISVLVMSFKRSSPIYFVRPGENVFFKGLPYSLISLFLGWWGIPWGPIWTLTTMATNISGGTDLTREVLAATGFPLPATSAPPVLSSEALARRETGKTRVLRIAWAVVALMFLGGAFVIYKIYNAGTNTAGEAHSARTEFRDANNHIGSTGAAASGNSPKATELAAQMCRTMQIVRDASFEQSKKKSFMDQNDQFKTYCDLKGSQCVFLVHVPELRRFNTEAKTQLGQSAWTTAENLLENSGEGKTGMRLAVGLRGIAAYDRVLVGQYLAGPRTAQNGIAEVYDGIGCESRIYSWFEPEPEPPRTKAQGDLQIKDVPPPSQ